jgi:hypothetical protein
MTHSLIPRSMYRCWSRQSRKKNISLAQAYWLKWCLRVARSLRNTCIGIICLSILNISKNHSRQSESFCWVALHAIVTRAPHSWRLLLFYLSWLGLSAKGTISPHGLSPELLLHCISLHCILSVATIFSRRSSIRTALLQGIQHHIAISNHNSILLDAWDDLVDLLDLLTPP